MVFSKYNFNKKCDFDMCQNSAEYVLQVGAKGNILMCEKCLNNLKKILKSKNGEFYERPTKN